MAVAPLYVKICGVTTEADAALAVDAGASAVGLNFVGASPRCVDAAAARRIADAVRGRARIVGVVADLDAAAARRLAHEVGLDALQLHGDEPDDVVVALAPLAYRAIRVAGPEDAIRAASAPGDEVLVDAFVPGRLGGTGVRVAPALVAPLARARRVILAGGLTPANVAEAVAAVRPWGVDVASGVERAPGVKDTELVRAFVAAARAATR